jgi:hypothetical protein
MIHFFSFFEFLAERIKLGMQYNQDSKNLVMVLSFLV